MRLLLVRHGESEHARLGLVAGERGCPGLTPRGRTQARALRQRLTDQQLRVDTLLSSPVPRARETARILRPALQPAGATVAVDRNLGEPDPGEGDGLTTDQFVARYGTLDPQVAPDRPRCRGGESWNAFLARVRDTTTSLPTRFPDQTVLAVTHAGFIVWFFLGLFAVPPSADRARLDPTFASLTEWEFDETQRYWRLISFNDTAHLQTDTGISSD